MFLKQHAILLGLGKKSIRAPPQWLKAGETLLWLYGFVA